MMRFLFGPNDWLGEHPSVCGAAICILVVLASLA